MESNLVIVESPAKAKTIEKFLGKDFLVKSSFGHIRDLAKKNLGINIKKRFLPEYVISDDKKKIVAELKKLAKEAETVWLASDEDREGEAIAWHLYEVLGLKPEKTRRIVFNEITKPAILNAIEHPRNIDQNLVNAQQARRILDRLVGFELSPLLWKKVRPALSAGRVQSVSVRLIVEREREILSFKTSSWFKITAKFEHVNEAQKTVTIAAEVPVRFATENDALAFLQKCIGSQFKVEDVVTKPSRKSPAPPFTTSTLQQEASRKLGYSVAQTMSVAQRLYESGKITYMRTDSVNLSDTALQAASKAIIDEYGEKYVTTRQYKTKSKGAQEAHEAIRPTNFEDVTISGKPDEKKLYELIWKRTIASQMSEALLEKTNITIGVSKANEKFVAVGEVIKFDGFLKVYFESTDEESDDESIGLLPPLNVGQELKDRQIIATERFTHHPARYTEASLVKKLEELGIGRPSTYAPTISTVQQRGYVSKEDRLGIERSFKLIEIKNNSLVQTVKVETTGSEKAKLFPTDIGMIVNDFLTEHFNTIMDYHFTAKVEKEFDDIADGKRVWNEMIEKFYGSFHSTVEKTLEITNKNIGERLIGEDPATGLPVIARMGKFGPMVQLGATDSENKPRFAGLQKGQYIESVTLEEALTLFNLPRKVGEFEEAVVTANIGRFGPYIQHKSAFYSLKKGVDDPYTIEIERAIELIEEKRLKDLNRIILIFEKDADLQVLNGRYGPYISYKKENYKIPKGVEPAQLTHDQCLEIIAKAKENPKPKKRGKK